MADSPFTLERRLQMFEKAERDATEITRNCYEFPQSRVAREHRVRLLAERYLAMTEPN